MGSRCAGWCSAHPSAKTSGADSSTTCAFVPLNPKELTPAMRGCPFPPHGVVVVGTTTGNVAQSTCGFGSFRCRCAGIISCWSASTVLITPATPAAASRWPMFVFTDPTASGVCRSAKTAPIARSSIGSPNGVPVPCASIYPTAAAVTHAFARAARSSCSWACLFGTVSPLLGPSWFTALPRTTARIVSPSRSASASRLRRRMPAPSPRPYPSAAASNVLQRPSGDSACICASATKLTGLSSRFTPPASAKSHSPSRRLWHARWRATSDDEQAVSTARVGP